MREPVRRLYVFAGKGGVGKTMLSLAFTRHLLTLKKKEKVFYTFFGENYSSHLCQKLDIPCLPMTMMGSVGSYMERKMGSKLIAGAILKTPFFRSLFHIVPGLGYVGLLGGLVDMLRKDDELTLVLDPPATGHILTMFSSLHNFREVFGTGVFAKDIDQINSLIRSRDFLRMTVVSLPTEMALQEAMELKDSLRNYCHDNIELAINDSLCQSDELKKDELPEFLCKKIELEKRVLDGEKAGMVLPHVFSNSVEQVIRKLSLHLEDFV